MDKKSEKIILVGFSETTEHYRVYDQRKKQVLTRRDVIIKKDTNNDIEPHERKKNENLV